MTTAAARNVANTAPDNWLSGVSTEPVFSIGKVQELLVGEFPSVSQAKLRLLERHGIVQPIRHSNGYRGYSQADIERIRYALRLQRDSYLPLDQIGQNLAILDRGGQPAEIEPIARIVSRDGELELPPASNRITVRQIMDYTGISAEALEEIVAAKLITPDLSGRFAAQAVAVVHRVSNLQNSGFELRNLRQLRFAANAALDLIANQTEPLRRKNSAAAIERSRAQAHDLARETKAFLEALIDLGVEEMSL